MSFKTLQKKIKDKKAKVGIIGLGYVGLPLAVEFAKAGVSVTGIDVTREKVEKLLKGVSYIQDVPSKELKQVINDKTFKPTTNFSKLKDADAVIICVPTPLRKSRDPDLSFIVSASESLSDNISKNTLVILESTSYPGTTREILLPELENRGFKGGRDVFVCFSPERVDPGNKTYGIVNTPKVVGGIDENSTKLGAELYSLIVDEVVTVNTCEEAEMVKLLENTFRAVNIGLINEMTQLCGKFGLDIWSVIKAASSKPFGFMPFYPGPGLGGHCLSEREFVTVRNSSRVKSVEMRDLYNKYSKDNENGILRPSGENLQALSFDLRTGTSCWKNVSALSKRSFTGEMVTINTDLGRSIRVTDRHPMVVEKKGRLGLKYAGEIREGDEIPYLKVYEQKKTSDEIDLIEELFKAGRCSPEIYKLNKIKVKPLKSSFREFKDIIHSQLNEFGIDYSARHEFIRGNYMYLEYFLKIEDRLPFKREDLVLYTGRGRITKVPAVIKLDGDFLRLAGYYVAEGCITEDKSIRTRFSFHEDESELIEDLKKILDCHGIKYSEFKDKGCRTRHIKVSSRIFGFLLKDVLNCGTDSYNAAVPREVFEMEKERIMQFLSGLLRGDGWVTVSKNSAAIGFGTCNENLLNEIILLLHQIGIYPSKKTQNAKKQTKPLSVLRIFGSEQVDKIKHILSAADRRKIRKADNKSSKTVKKYKFREKANYILLKVTGIVREKVENCNVYSMEVNDTHTFVSTTGMIVHNCIPVDPQFLAWKAKTSSFYPHFIDYAEEINRSMPEYVLTRISNLLNKDKKSANGAKIHMMGVSYKKNVGDMRESPAYEIAQMLIDSKAKVTFTDPYVRSFMNLKRIPEKNVKYGSYDCVVIVTAHDKVDYGRMVNEAKNILDCRGVTLGMKGKARIERI